MKVLPIPVAALACAAVAAAVALAVRHLLLEVPAIGWRCVEAGAPAWCSLYAGLGWLLRTQALGAAAAAVATMALLTSSRVAVCVAAAAGAAALVLYNAELGAVAVLLAALRAVRL
ncbi:MAG TPA: hypothetical protein VLR47_04815 [Rhodospirillales bacterium]|nr:hypothetical protein [Rhodospirillales bacterium]